MGRLICWAWVSPEEHPEPAHSPVASDEMCVVLLPHSWVLGTGWLRPGTMWLQEGPCGALQRVSAPTASGVHAVCRVSCWLGSGTTRSYLFRFKQQ